MEWVGSPSGEMTMLGGNNRERYSRDAGVWIRETIHASVRRFLEHVLYSNLIDSACLGNPAHIAEHCGKEGNLAERLDAVEGFLFGRFADDALEVSKVA